MADRVALVTGGSGGIGAAICRALAADGVTVLVGYGSDVEAATAVADTCGGRAEPIAFDVTDLEQIHAAVERASELGSLEVLVHAAGVTADGLLLRLAPEDWDDLMAVNLRGAYLAARSALRPMLRRRWGRIVFVGSVVGERGNAGQTAYAASKAGLGGLARSLAREVGGKGVTVNVLSPGWVETAMTADLPPQARAAHLDATPTGRPVTPEEVAAAVSFLASDGAGSVTGAVLPVDGGAGI